MFRRETSCVTYETWFKLVSVIAMIDISITTIIPFFTISIINLMIAIRLKKDSFYEPSTSITICYSKSRLDSLAVSSQSKSFIKKQSIVLSNYRKSSRAIAHSTHLRRVKSYSEATKTLLIISLMFLILHSPIAFDKIFYFINENFTINLYKSNVVETKRFTANANTTYRANTTEASSYMAKIEANYLEEILERIACYIYYSNFSLNFFLYTYNKSKFRKNILKIFRRNCLVKLSFKK